MVLNRFMLHNMNVKHAIKRNCKPNRKRKKNSTSNSNFEKGFC